jgi:hypothetical protein
MQSHQVIGTVLIVAGLIDAATSLWLPTRIPDERQRATVRVVLLASGLVVIALGGMFLAGIVGAPTSPEQ